MKKAKKSPLIYCGPTIRNELKQFTIFSGPIPENVKKIASECGKINTLIVSTSELSKVRRNLETQGTKEHSAFLDVVHYLGGGENV